MSSAMRAQRLQSREQFAQIGGRIILIAFACVQFVDVTLFTIGGFVLSAQKLVIIAVLPIAVIMVGRYWLPAILGAFGVTYVATLSVAPLFGEAVVPNLGDYLVTGALSIGAVGAVATALASTRSAAHVLSYAWAIAAAVSALLTVAQFAGLLPLFTVPESELLLREAAGTVRATGLKSDPNFQAIVLCLGLSFTRVFFPRGIRRLLLTVTISAGIFCTLSRMGVIIAIIVLLASAMLSANASGTPMARSVRLLASVISLLIAIWAVYSLLPEELRTYVDTRSGDLIPSIAGALSGEQTGSVFDSSGAQRSALLQGTIQVIATHPLVGVGAGMLPDHLYQLVGVRNAAHNTYLEFWAVGGIFGVIALVFYGIAIVRGLLRLRLSSDIVVFHGAMLFAVVVGVAALFVTLTYNLILWLPLTLVVGLCGYGVDSGSRKRRRLAD